MDKVIVLDFGSQYTQLIARKIRELGVMGDRRTYQSVVVRLVRSVDGMTADWYPASPKLLSRISNRIVNEVEGVNRVVYDTTSKPPGTIEWE